jgi:BASS family bile acid:Na+ symporter
MATAFLMILMILMIIMTTGDAFMSPAVSAVNKGSYNHCVVPVSITATTAPRHKAITMARNQFHKNHFGKRVAVRVMESSSSSDMSGSSSRSSAPRNSKVMALMDSLAKALTTYAPLWTILASLVGYQLTTLSTHNTRACWMAGALSSLPTMQGALAVLMLVMGLTISPSDLSRACQSPGVLVLNGVCCFGIMPLVAILLSRIFGFTPDQTIGTVLLGSVSGGQASNLFALLAGGNVALSVVCTLSTTVLGVLATPMLIQGLLGCSVTVDAMAVLRSVATLVLLPVSTGLALGQLLPAQDTTQDTTQAQGTNTVAKISRVGPAIGVVATLLLVAGGAANAAQSLLLFASGNNVNNSINSAGGMIASTAVACIGMPVLGGALALGLARLVGIRDEASKRTLVVEVLSKSPTLAYVLARTHFSSSPACATIPAAAMVSLAALGATVAALWTRLSPIHQSTNE